MNSVWRNKFDKVEIDHLEIAKGGWIIYIIFERLTLVPIYGSMSLAIDKETIRKGKRFSRIQRLP